MKVSEIRCESVNAGSETVQVRNMEQAANEVIRAMEQKQFTCHAAVVYITALHGLLTVRKTDDDDESNYEYEFAFVTDGSGGTDWGCAFRTATVYFGKRSDGTFEVEAVRGRGLASKSHTPL